MFDGRFVTGFATTTENGAATKLRRKSVAARPSAIEVTRFLMESALLDEMDAELCAHVTGVAGCEALLDDSRTALHLLEVTITLTVMVANALASLAYFIEPAIILRSNEQDESPGGDS